MVAGDMVSVRGEHLRGLDQSRTTDPAILPEQHKINGSPPTEAFDVGVDGP